MTEQGTNQVVERLADIVTRCPYADRLPEGLYRLSGDIRCVAEQVRMLSLDGQAMKRLVFSPLEAGLVARFGTADGPRICGRLITALRDELSDSRP